MSKQPQRIPDQLSMLEELFRPQSIPVRNAQIGDAGDEAFDIAGGTLDIAAAIRACLTRCIKQTKYSRWQIAARMSEMLDREITKYQLDAWTAGTKDGHRFPLEYLPAFVQATGSFHILKLVAAYCGGDFVENADTLHLELGRIADQERILRDRKRAIQKLLKEE